MILEMPGYGSAMSRAWPRWCRTTTRWWRPRAENRGILFLTPHLGCFEITARYLARLMPMTVMFRPPRKDILAPLLETARNSSAVNAVPATMQGVREFVRALRRGESVGMLPDQAPGGRRRLGAFFGRMATP